MYCCDWWSGSGSGGGGWLPLAPSSQQVAEAANKKFKFDMKGQGILQEHGQVLGRLLDVVKTWLKETDGTDAKPISLMGDVSLMLPKGPDTWMLYEGRSVRPPFHHKMLYVPSIADILQKMSKYKQSYDPLTKPSTNGSGLETRCLEMSVFFFLWMYILWKSWNLACCLNESCESFRMHLPKKLRLVSLCPSQPRGRIRPPLFRPQSMHFNHLDFGQIQPSYFDSGWIRPRWLTWAAVKMKVVEINCGRNQGGRIRPRSK